MKRTDNHHDMKSSPTMMRDFPDPQEFVGAINGSRAPTDSQVIEVASKVMKDDSDHCDILSKLER